MARVYTNGFEIPNARHFMTLGPGIQSWSTAVKRTGSYGAQLRSNDGRYMYGFLPTPASEFFVRFALARWGSNQGTNVANIVSLGINSDSAYFKIGHTQTKLVFRMGSTNIITSSFDIGWNYEWHLIEARIVMADSGYIELRADGSVVGTYTGDTKPDTNTQMTYLFLGHSGGLNADYYIDDLAINDTTGSENNSWCGNGYVLPIRPTAAGSSTQWTPISGDNYAAVDDPAAHDGDTTAIYTATTGMKDYYTLADPTIPANSIIRGVFTETVARRTTSDADQIKTLLYSGSTETASSAQGLSLIHTGYYSDFLPTNPDDGAAWEEADLNALQLGVESVIA